MLATVGQWLPDLTGLTTQPTVFFLWILFFACAALIALYLSMDLRVNLYWEGPASKAMLVALLVVAYSLCSSMLLILNKVTVTYIPAPSFILCCQLGSCALFVKVAALAGMVDAEPLEWEKSKKFALIVFGFIGTLFSNITALQFVPVDTIICFRASTPILIAIIEFLYLGRELPCARSWASLVGVFGGVAAYTWHDINFTKMGYVWLGVWYTFTVFEIVYVKKVVDSVKMTTWSRTYYQNTLAFVPMLAITAFSGEVQVLAALTWKTKGVLLLCASCAGGVGMSYFSFALRAVISATLFSVIGNVCKVLTILTNLVIWDKHSNTMGTLALLGCLGAGSAYQQAPMRPVQGRAEEDSRKESLLAVKSESNL
ncbi:g6656 [Coccomyxa viridis]|uniref:G6656 protein n=1 Tax=Coccomyxa viridis TaxID=1274662 RepID=A0ABP1FVW3_9CHLO